MGQPESSPLEQLAKLAQLAQLAQLAELVEFRTTHSPLLGSALAADHRVRKDRLRRPRMHLLRVLAQTLRVFEVAEQRSSTQSCGCRSRALAQKFLARGYTVRLKPGDGRWRDSTVETRVKSITPLRSEVVDGRNSLS